MDQDIFRKTYREVNERFCAFEKGVLTNNCDCSQAKRFCIAEREGVHCGADAAQAQCLELLEILREQARFTLKGRTGRTSIPHAKAMKVQVGGLRGLEAALHPDAPPPAVIADVYGTIEAAKARFGDIQSIPMQPVIQQIAAYQGRQRSRRRREP